jgi:hypothetical protein
MLACPPNPARAFTAQRSASAERAKEAREDRLACVAWNHRMLGYTVPAQPSPTKASMTDPSNQRLFSSKQMGDACEMLVAAELTLAGIPSLKVPDNWPGYDVVAQPRDGSAPIRISVKARTFKRGGSVFVDYWMKDVFDWLAIVILPADTETKRRIFLIPRSVANENARRDGAHTKTTEQRYWRIDEVARRFAQFENNFTLNASFEVLP